MRFIAAMLLALFQIITPGFAQSAFKQQNALLFQQLQKEHNLSPAQMDRLKVIFARSGFIGQGNPAVARHPMSVEECRARAPRGGAGYSNPVFERICGGKNMAPLFDPRTETARDAKVCIDQFEFPDIPCVYPVVWVKAKEAAEICSAMGKRICDAHEWEGACAGRHGLWLTYPNGALAYTILMDQFPRNMFRNLGKAFTSDSVALAATKSAIDKGWDLRVDEPARQFFYMPLMHSENLETAVCLM